VRRGYISLFGPSCYRILDDGVCELDRGHDGDHLPYVPGDYLPLPLITPLHILTLMQWGSRLNCPLCGTRAESVTCDGPVVIYREFEGPGSTECEWWFGPCGCRGREIVTDDVVQLVTSVD
jgi:hypothetical protein